MIGDKSATVGAGCAQSSDATEANRAQPRPTDEARAIGVCDSPDPIEAALAEGLRGATAAGRWEVVAQLARELEARRKAHEAGNVVRLDAAKRTTQT